jgi:predicted  nucleic acid-binding Zn-ribbon protein
MKPEDELEILEEMKKDLEAELEDIRRRIEELRKDLTE